MRSQNPDPSRRFAIAALTIVALLWPELSRAGATHEDCREPFIYSDAAVNVVVLPYRYVGEGKPRMTQTGLRLATLTQLHSLFHMLRYSSVGAVQMEMPVGRENDPQCEAGIVWNKVMGKIPGAIEPLPRGHGVVLLWGLLYEEGDEIYVKSYARFGRKGVPEDVKFRAADVDLVARPSNETISFAPQLLQLKDLEKIESAYKTANVVRPSPNEDVAGQPIPTFVRKCATCPMPKPGFWVEEQQGSWIRVHWMDPMLGTKNGWIRAETKIGELSLDDLMPELDFVQGLVGYLRYRAGGTGGLPPVLENTVAYALADFDRFHKESEPQSSQSAFALGLELSGLLLALRDGPGDLTRASQTLREAADLEPDSGAIRNLSACVQIWQEWKSARLGAHAKAQADQLIAATVLDSHSDTNLSNLRALYQLLLNAPQASLEPAISREELQRRLQKIDAAKSSLDN